MEQEREYRQRQVDGYKKQLAPLLRYLPWLEKNAGASASSTYRGQDMGEHVLAFPVYDGTLLSFLKETEKTGFIDKNYRYIYSRHHIKDHDDERRLIQNAGINEWNILCGILSNYVLGGRTKGTLWSEAVQESIFFLIVQKMCSIIEYWDKPIGR